MRLWASIVITNMFSRIPFIGKAIAEFIWGGFRVGPPTLTRFYRLHFLLPFILIAGVVVHLMYLHQHGSSNPLGVTTNVDKLPFHSYFIFKDIYGFLLIFLFLVLLVSYYPDMLGHSDNYIEANPLVTPASIVPEFYFLAFYAILRAVPHKLGGVVLMFRAILVLFLLPYLNRTRIRGISFSLIRQGAFWTFISNFLVLTWLGGQHATDTFVLYRQIGTSIYFGYFLIALPLFSWTEHSLLQRESAPLKEDIRRRKAVRKVRKAFPSESKCH